jgi:hypothetical protein
MPNTKAIVFAAAFPYPNQDRHIFLHCRPFIQLIKIHCSGNILYPRMTYGRAGTRAMAGVSSIAGIAPGREPDRGFLPENMGSHARP